MTDQLDMFDMLALDTMLDAEATRGTPTLFVSCARGIDARIAETAAWSQQWGRLGGFAQSHGWHAQMTVATEPTTICQPSVLVADLRCRCFADDGCECVGELVYRAVCRCCRDWESERIVDDESVAAMIALDHAHPGWRDCPVVTLGPHNDGPKKRWAQAVREQYGDRPDGWPIITDRGGPVGLRAVPGRSPWGGYDVAARSLDASL